MTNTPPIRIMREGAVEHVILDRPESRNALNLEMCGLIAEAFERLDSDETIRVVLIEANGSVFCAGADLKERSGKDSSWVRRRRLAAFTAYDRIEKCRKPVIALVHGSCIGSGGEIAMAADFIVAADDALFRFPETQWGTVGATQRLQRIIGKRSAKEILFTGRTVDAAEACKIGLVARVVSRLDLNESGKNIALEIAKAPQLAIMLTKQAVDLGEEVDLSTGIRIELAAIDRNLAEGSWRKGIDEFMDVIGSRKTT